MKYLTTVAVLAGLLTTGAALAEDDPQAGHKLVEENCARCHAVETTGESPNPDAPPFRTFSKKWPLENLEEALAEGIVVGHQGVDMPEFVFEPDQISDIIAYLGTLNET
ncbi:c-type cytochrome [Microbaculum sp. FT89]|uniref:c-type cytochrome n=1 Tax=Microbaculum sp. FT89 TaxID=3447298 RepID=UPI003F534F62